MEINPTPSIREGTNITSKSTTLAKTFTIADITCEYQNTNTIRIQPNGQQTPKLVISNFLCKQLGNKLCKVTEIKFGDKTFLLEDQYRISKKAQNIIQQTQIKNFKSEPLAIPIKSASEMDEKKQKMQKKQLFKKKRNFHTNNLLRERRDTKNVVKNFIKAFYKTFDEQKTQPYLRLKNMIDAGIFNNKVIQSIVEDSELCPSFQYFLQNEAEQWVQSSRVRDKQVHRQAIEVYLNFIKQSKNGSSQTNENKQTNQKSSDSKDDKEDKEEQIFKDE